MSIGEAPGTVAVERASHSSFYQAMRILPRAQREAMFEIYAFCRQVDDIADSPGPRAARREQLQEWRLDINSLYAGKPVPRTKGLVAPVAAFGLRREDFHGVIDGMEMDAITDIRAPDEAVDLIAIGWPARWASSVRVFGMQAGRACAGASSGTGVAADEYPARPR
jgi:phytoene synthase